jgi:hypothetical protein
VLARTAGRVGPVIAMPPLPSIATARRALVIATIDASAMPAGATVDELVETQLAAGADIVALDASEVADASLAVRDRLLVDLGDGSAATDLSDASLVTGRVDRWDAGTVDDVVAAGTGVLVGCTAAGVDTDPALPRLRAGLGRAVSRLVAAGADPDRLVVDARPAPGTALRAQIALLAGHRHLRALGRPVVGSVPAAPTLLGLAGTVPGPIDAEAAVVAVASVLAAAGCRAVRTSSPAAVRRVLTVQAAIEQARR